MTKAVTIGISKYKFHGYLGGKRMKMLIYLGEGERVLARENLA